MFASIKSLFRGNDMNEKEKHMLYLMDKDGYVTKDSFTAKFHYYWFRKTRLSLEKRGYKVVSVTRPISGDKGKYLGTDKRWYLKK